MRTSRTGRYLSDLAQNESIRTASKLDNDKVEENAGSGPTAIVSRLDGERSGWQPLFSKIYND